MTTQINQLWSDVNPEFKNKSPLDELLFGVASVNNSIRNIILISVGERFKYFTFGSLVYDYIGKPQAPAVEARLLRHLITIVEKWEPRVKIDAGRSSVQRMPTENRWRVSLFYRIQRAKVSGTFQEVISVNGV